LLNVYVKVFFEALHRRESVFFYIPPSGPLGQETTQRTSFYNFFPKFHNPAVVGAQFKRSKQKQAKANKNKQKQTNENKNTIFFRFWTMRFEKKI